jgi:PAS domain S-box-containing protein
MTRRAVLLVFEDVSDLISGERLLKARTGVVTARLGRAGTDHGYSVEIVRIQGVEHLRRWLRVSAEPKPISFIMALKSEFDLHNQAMAALNAMEVQLHHVLSASQDQVVVLDREQRMVAFFGQWPEQSPRSPENMLGKRKRDVFGPEVASLHEAAALRALNGENTVYEWSITDVPRPVQLFTSASPLRKDDGEVAGVVLVTRNVTALKRTQIEFEKALKDKTNQLLALQRAVAQIAASFEGSAAPGEPEAWKTSGLHTTEFLSEREREVLNLLRKGARVQSIARTLGISIETVRRHVKAMFRKTGVHSQEALVKLFADAS